MSKQHKMFYSAMGNDDLHTWGDRYEESKMKKEIANNWFVGLVREIGYPSAVEHLGRIYRDVRMGRAGIGEEGYIEYENDQSEKIDRECYTANEG